MKIFELGQRVEVVSTVYESEHLAVGSLGTVKMFCIYMNGKEELETMYELRMDDDAYERTWAFLSSELKAVK